MEIPVYLAMTAAEFRTDPVLPPHPAWLSCLFSPYGRGLSNVPKQLPPGSLLILSDRTPPCGHDPELIFDTLSEVTSNLSCSGLLLDFERPGSDEAASIAKRLTALPCPVAVSALYARGLDCPVFIPPLPPSEPPEPHIAPWAGREIWLEISAQAQFITVTESGSTIQDCTIPPLLPHKDQNLICHYATNVQDNAITFSLTRTMEDILELFTAHPSHSISCVVGLHQDFIQKL